MRLRTGLYSEMALQPKNGEGQVQRFGRGYLDLGSVLDGRQSYSYFSSTSNLVAPLYYTAYTYLDADLRYEHLRLEGRSEKPPTQNDSLSSSGCLKRISSNSSESTNLAIMAVSIVFQTKAWSVEGTTIWLCLSVYTSQAVRALPQPPR